MKVSIETNKDGKARLSAVFVSSVWASARADPRVPRIKLFNIKNAFSKMRAIPTH
jgi:hypothetical protein